MYISVCVYALLVSYYIIWALLKILCTKKTNLHQIFDANKRWKHFSSWRSTFFHLSIRKYWVSARNISLLLHCYCRFFFVFNFFERSSAWQTFQFHLHFRPWSENAHNCGRFDYFFVANCAFALIFYELQWWRKIEIELTVCIVILRRKIESNERDAAIKSNRE